MDLFDIRQTDTVIHGYRRCQPEQHECRKWPKMGDRAWLKIEFNLVQEV